MNGIVKEKWFVPALLGAVAVIAVVVVVLLVALPGGGSSTPKGQLGVSVTKTSGLDSQFSIFATLASNKGKIIWTKRVYSDKPFSVGNLPANADRLALTASPCAPSKTSTPKGSHLKVPMSTDCSVFHGGMTLGNWPLRSSGKTKAPTHLKIIAKCQVAKDASGLNCDGSTVKIS